MAQTVLCLTNEHEDLTSDPQHPPKLCGVAAPICNPSTGEADWRIPGAPWPDCLAELVSSWVS